MFWAKPIKSNAPVTAHDYDNTIRNSVGISFLVFSNVALLAKMKMNCFQDVIIVFLGF